MLKYECIIRSLRNYDSFLLIYHNMKM